jgi:hydroxysqualene dehydroxylase
VTDGLRSPSARCAQLAGAPEIAVVGGGLAGVTAALACTDAGARVRLFEARAWLGGATFSTEKRGLSIDNGQHVFMRCCTAYRGLLARLGVEHLVELQPRLAVPVLAPGRPRAWIRRHALPAPAHLAPSLLGFAHLPLAARLRAARAARGFAALDPDDRALDDESLGDWLAKRGVRDAASLAFWDLLIRPTLNVRAPEASLALAARVLRTGFSTAPTPPTSASRRCRSRSSTTRRRAARWPTRARRSSSARRCAA